MILLLAQLTSLQFAQNWSDSLLFLSDVEVIEIFILQQVDNEGANLEEVYNKIEFYKSNKIEVRNAKTEELKILPGINDEILTMIIELKKSKFISRSAFLRKEVTEKINLHLVAQFLIFDDEIEKYKLIIKNRVISKSSYSEQGQSDKYKGELFTNYNLISLKSENITAGASYKRDAGELFKYGSATYYLQMKNILLFDNTIIGNYSVNFGQGILISTNPNYYYSTMSIKDIFRSNELLRGSTSSNHLYSLKGGAAEVGIGNLKSALFYSKNNLAATIDTLNNLKSIYSENYFRTENEINKLNRVNEEISGMFLIYNLNDNFNFGYGFRKTEYSKSVPLKYLSENIEKINFNSVIANYANRKFNIKLDFSGEENIIENKIISLQIYPTKKFSFIINKREYSSLYKLNYVNPITSQSNLALKENGILYGILISDIYNTSINSFVDNYEITETNLTKTSGSEVGVRIYKSNNKYNYFEFTKKYINSISQMENEDIISKNITTMEVKNKYRLQIQNNYKNIMLLNKFEFIELPEINNYEKGILVSTTANYKPNKKFKFIANITFYKTDSFKSRVYEFESNGRGYLAFVPLYSSGIKKTVSADIELFKNFNISIRYSQNIFSKNELFYSSPFKNSSEVILQIDYSSF